MKKFIPIILLAQISALTILGISFASLSSSTKQNNPLQATSFPTDIDLNDTSEQEIRDYYSYLNALPESERRGTNLLKNLKYILVNNPNNTAKPAQYYTFSEVREIYRITDRQWVASPASEIEGYDSSTNTIKNFDDYNSNPYLYYYYRSDNFTNPHAANAKITATDGSTMTLLNQEHLWSVSHGFTGDNRQIPNAGTDLHHLVAADGPINQWGHSNHSYGYVSDEKDAWRNTTLPKWDNGANAILGNKLGYGSDKETIIFEPQDNDKGDIARSLFYMAARYNNYSKSATPTQQEPDLELVDYALEQSLTCDGTETGKYGILSDLLKWHVDDPVTNSSDEGYYELHRNNLIYENYQNTRNPFIDFPEWVDYVWGDKKETGCASPLTDTVNGYNSEQDITSISLNASSINLVGRDTFQATVSSVSPEGASKAVSWSTSDESIATVSSSGSIQGVSTGVATITATSEINHSVTSSITVNVTRVDLEGITLSNSQLSLQLDDEQPLAVNYIPSNALNKNVTWTSSNSDVASVSATGLVKALGKGSATITCTAEDGGYVATCVVAVSTTKPQYYYERISDAKHFVSGKYLIVCNKYKNIMDGSLDDRGLKTTFNNISYDDYYDSYSDIIESNAVTDASTFTIDVSNGTLLSSSGFFIGSTGNRRMEASSTTQYTHSITFDVSGNAKILSTSSTGYYLQTNSSDKSSFRFYATSQVAIQLYRYTDGTSPEVVGSYKLITSLENVTSGNYVLASILNDKYYALSNEFPSKAGAVTAIDITEKVTPYNEILTDDGDSLAVTLDVSSGNASIYNESKYLVSSGSSSTNLVASDSKTSWAVTKLEGNYGTFQFEQSTRKLGLYASSPYFKGYASLGTKYRGLELFKYETKVVNKTKTHFAEALLNSITCDSTGVTKPTFVGGTSWSYLKELFESLSLEDRLDILKSYGSSSDTISLAVAKYDYIVGKYGTSEYEDFIKREPTPIKSSLSINNLNNDTNSIVLIALLIGLSIGFTTIVFIKKHR